MPDSTIKIGQKLIGSIHQIVAKFFATKTEIG